MRLYLQTLSPVHIGSGRDIEPFEYIITKGRFYRINTESAMRKLYESGNWEKYEEWLNDIDQRFNNAVQNKEKSIIRRDINPVDFCSKQLKQPKLAEDIINNHSLYQAVCRRHETYRIREAIKTPNGEIYVPGSSIKGAIRTALVYAVLSENPMLWDQAYKTIQYHVRSPQKAGTELEKLIICCGEKKINHDGKPIVIFGDAKFDLMKIIKVSDTFKPAAGLEVSSTAVFSVDRKTHQIKKVMDTPVEMIVPRSTFQLELEIDRNFLLNAGQYESKNNWIGLKDKMKLLFGIDINKITEQTIDEAQNHIFQRIKKTCLIFSKDNLENDQIWLEKLPQDTSAKLKDYLNNLSAIEWPVKLGWGSSWTGTTIGLFLKKNNMHHDFDELNKKFKIAKGNPGIRDFPLSRRLTHQGEVPTMPFGWISLNTSPVDTLEKEEIIFKEKKPFDILKERLVVIKPTDAGRIGQLIDEALVKLETNYEKKEFANAVKDHMGSVFKKSKAGEKLKKYLADN